MNCNMLKLSFLLLFGQVRPFGLRYVPPGNDSLIGYLVRAAESGTGSNPVESIVLGTAAEKLSRNCANEVLQPLVPCLQWLEGTVGNFIFSISVNETVNSNLENPGYFGLTDTKAFFIECATPFLASGCTEGTKLLAWLLEPTTTYNGVTILYMHGIGGTVGYDLRIEKYNALRAEGYRILTFDYRGFGISSKVDAINEESTVADARLAMSWLENSLEAADRYAVWGHSFGGAIAVQAVSKQGGSSALVLEATFNNFKDALDFYSSAYPPAVAGISMGIYRVEVISNQFRFESDVSIRTINIPMLSLHAEDDQTVSIELGRKLFQSAKGAGKDITMIEFPASLGYGHNQIAKDPNFSQIVNSFIVP